MFTAPERGKVRDTSQTRMSADSQQTDRHQRHCYARQGLNVCKLCRKSIEATFIYSYGGSLYTHPSIHTKYSPTRYTPPPFSFMTLKINHFRLR